MCRRRPRRYSPLVVGCSLGKRYSRLTEGKPPFPRDPLPSSVGPLPWSAACVRRSVSFWLVRQKDGQFLRRSKNGVLIYFFSGGQIFRHWHILKHTLDKKNDKPCDASEFVYLRIWLSVGERNNTYLRTIEWHRPTKTGWLYKCPPSDRLNFANNQRYSTLCSNVANRRFTLLKHIVDGQRFANCQFVD